MSVFKKLLMSSGAILIAASTAHGAVVDKPYFKVSGLVLVWGANNYQEQSGTAPIVSDFLLLGTSGTAGADIISGDVYTVLTGTLTPSSDNSSVAGGSLADVTGETSGGVFTDGGTTGFLDASDSFTAFGIDATTDVTVSTSARKSSFYVASNTAFDIFAKADNLATTGDFSTLTLANITYAMGITVSGTDGGLAFGGSAQNPSVGGTGVITSVDSLDDIAADTKVFDGGRRTAASTGGIAAQSVRFDVTYGLSTGGGPGYDLSLGAGSIEARVTYTIYAP